MNKLSVTLGFFVLVAAQDRATGASFDCSKATSAREKTVCGSPELSIADERLAGAYQDALESSPHREEIRESQRAWLKDVLDDCPDEGCIDRVYSARTEELRRMTWGFPGVVEVGDLLKVTCDPKGGRVLVEPAPYRRLLLPSALRPPPTPTGKRSLLLMPDLWPGECVIPQGPEVRIKLSSGLAEPYGECGSDPEIWLSLWFNKAKVESLRQVSGRCSKEEMTQIDITAEGIRWCKKVSPHDNDEEAKEICSFRTAEDMPAVRDVIEYPRLPYKGPLPGMVVVEHAADRELCNSMLSRKVNSYGKPYWNVVPPPKATIFEEETETARWKYAGYFRRLQFDADNDGKSDDVYGLHASTHYLDADIFWLPSDKSAASAWPEINEKLLWKHSRLVVPHSWGTCGKGKKCTAEDDEDGEYTLQHYRESGKAVSLSLRYLHFTPFRYKKTTYFLAEPVGRDGVMVLFQPKGSKAEEACIFRRVRDNY